MVQVAALPQVPQGVAGADPGVAEVLGVAVAGDDVVPVGEGAVHLLDVVGGEDVVGVEDDVAVEAVGVILPDMLDEGLQGVALAHLLLVEPLVDGGTVAPGDVGGVVGAVVRQHEGVDQGGVIGLSLDGGEQVAQHVLLIARADQHGEAVGRGGLVCPVLEEPDHGDVEKLVCIGQEKEDTDDPVDHSDSSHRGTPFRAWGRSTSRHTVSAPGSV